MTATDTTRAGLIRAVCEQPGDDHVRLVLADWLDENGDPARAEFIRTQVELANIGHLHPPADAEDRIVIRRHGVLRTRERSLLLDNWTAWAPRLTPGSTFEVVLSDKWTFKGTPAVRFARGFVSDLTCTAAAFTPDLARALFAAEPVTAVRLADRDVDQTIDLPVMAEWYRADDPDELDEADSIIPAHLWEVVAIDTRCRLADHAAGIAEFDTAALAHAALSAACVAWARGLVGLPPLTPEAR